MAESEKDVKEFITDCAREVFAKYGFNKTTMNDIAAAVKKGKSSLYHYFASKEQVFEAILTKEVALIKNDVTEAVSRESTPQGKLRALLTARLNFVQKAANFYSAIRDEFLDHYGFIERFRKNFDQEERDYIKEILEIGIKENVFSINDLDTTAYCICLTVKSIEPVIIAESDPTISKKYQDYILDLIFNGINKR